MDDGYEGAAVGQLVLVCVNVLGGLVAITAGHEVTVLNEKERYMETCYLFKGKSLGSQQIRLKTCKNGFTEITHHTIYKSGSWLRDKILYPFFHTKAIKEFHANIRNYLNRH